MLFWKLIDENPSFFKYLLHNSDILEVIGPLIVFLSQARLVCIPFIPSFCFVLFFCFAHEYFSFCRSPTLLCQLWQEVVVMMMLMMMACAVWVLVDRKHESLCTCANTARASACACTPGPLQSGLDVHLRLHSPAS